MANDFFQRDQQNNEAEDDFSPEILAAFAQYPVPPLSSGFTTRFWAHWETRRDRYRGVLGMLRRLWEVEIEGVAVWRLAASTLSGGTICTLAFGVLCAIAHPNEATSLPLPLNPREVPATAMNLYAFYNRDWESGFYLPKALPKNAPPHPGRNGTNDKTGGGLSWNGLNAQLA